MEFINPCMVLLNKNQIVRAGFRVLFLPSSFIFKWQKRGLATENSIFFHLMKNIWGKRSYFGSYKCKNNYDFKNSVGEESGYLG